MGEDIILSERIFPLQKKGFYVDVGAHHPFLSSNTYLLYKRGWSGINVDPNSESVRALRWFRSRDINLCMGVGAERAKKAYYRFSHTGVNTFSREMMEKKRKEPWITFLGEEKVDVAPLGEILDAHVPEGTRIDLLDVDVEGLDYEVLQSNNWDKYVPRVIVVEDRTFDTSHPEYNDIYQFLTAKGYVLYALMGITLIFVCKQP